MALPFDRSKPGVWISGGVHVALVLVALFAVASEKLPDADEGIPVEVVTDSQLAEITKGEQSAAQVRPDAKPRVDRVDAKREERDPGDAKQDAPAPPKRPAEMKTAEEDTAAPPPPPPPPQRLAEAKPEPIPAAAPPPPPTRPEPPKPDARAEAAKAEAATRAEAAKAAALKVAEAREAEAIEDARREAAEKAAEARAAKAADAKAKAEADSKAKAAAASRAKAEADAKAALDAKTKVLAEADAKAQAEARAKAQALADAKAKAEADADAKAEADAKAKAKAVAAAKAKAADEARARRQAEAADKFSPGDIRQMLAAKAPSQSAGSTGLEVQRTASLGAAAGNGQRLNPSQRSQLVGLLSDQLHRCWQVPIAAQSTDKPPVPTVRVQLKPDGTLLADPVVMNTGDGLFRTVAESATRATRRCAPLKIPSQFAPFYQDWKDLVVNFDPREAG